MFLSHDEIAQLTGYVRCADQIKWLCRKAWEGLDETVRMALKGKLSDWKAKAAEWDEQIATQS